MGTKMFKVSLLGDGAVGKTSLKERFVSGVFTDKYIQTLGVDFATHSIKLPQQTIKTQIWDIAGQPVFNSIRRGFFLGSLGGLIVYDVTRPETFQNIENGWLRPFINVVGSVPCVLIANKTDLVNERKVDRETGERYANQLMGIIGHPVLYIETSAKEGTNVSHAFESLAKTVVKINPKGR